MIIKFQYLRVRKMDLHISPVLGDAGNTDPLHIHRRVQQLRGHGQPNRLGKTTSDTHLQNFLLNFGWSC